MKRIKVIGWLVGIVPLAAVLVLANSGTVGCAAADEGDADSDADTDVDTDADTDSDADGDMGDACASKNDCKDRVCLSTPTGKRCTKGCSGDGDCAALSGWTCETFSTSGGPVDVCAPTSGDADTDADTDMDSDADSDADTDADSDADTDADSDADTDADTDADSDADTDADTDADSDADTDADPGDDCTADGVCDGTKAPLCVGDGTSSFCTYNCAADGDCTPNPPNGFGANACCADLNDGSKACLPAQFCAGDQGVGEDCGTGVGNCQADLVCIVESEGAEVGKCRQSCDPASPNCPTGFMCATLSDGVTGACLPEGSQQWNEECGTADKQCAAGLICILTEEGATTGACWETCDPDNNPDCPLHGGSCVGLTSGGGACVPPGDATFANSCDFVDNGCIDGLECFGLQGYDSTFCNKRCESAACEQGWQCIQFCTNTECTTTASYCLNGCSSDGDCASITSDLSWTCEDLGQGNMFCMPQ